MSSRSRLVIESKGYWAWHTFLVVLSLQSFARVLRRFAIFGNAQAIAAVARRTLSDLRRLLLTGGKDPTPVALIDGLFQEIRDLTSEDEAARLFELATRDPDTSEQGWVWSILLSGLVSTGARTVAPPTLSDDKSDRLRRFADEHVRLSDLYSSEEGLFDVFPSDRDFVGTVPMRGGDLVDVSGQITDMLSWGFFRDLWAYLGSEFSASELNELLRWGRRQARAAGIPADLVSFPTV